MKILRAMRLYTAKLGILSMLVLVLGPALALAADKEKLNEKRVVADTAEKFALVASEVREEMMPGGRYEFIRPDNRVKVDADLDKIGSLLQQSGSVEAMNPDLRVQLFNTQEHLNGILTHSDSNRLVCERAAPVGTNIPVTTCKSFGELERMRHDAQQYMRDHSRDANINSAAINRGG
jgi:hypothetical protein